MATTKKPKIVDVDVKEPQDIKVPEKVEETPKVVYGVVTAVRLNVRRAPSLDAAVAAIVNADDELKIDRDKSDKEWYAVTTEKRVRGFVMKKFVKVKR